MSHSGLDAEKIESNQEERTANLHRIDSLNLLIFTALLVIVVLTIWIFKRRNFRYLHKTCLPPVIKDPGSSIMLVTNFQIFAGKNRKLLRKKFSDGSSITGGCNISPYGFIIDAILRHINLSNTKLSSLKLNYTSLSKNSISNWISFKDQNMSTVYLYTFQGPFQKLAIQFEEQKATLDSEIFFNIILPLIIFHAGHSMKRKNFFRNLGAVLMFALLGTTIACISAGIMVYGSVRAFKSLNFLHLPIHCILCAISATDPG